MKKLISATEFKSRCLELLDRINGTSEVITITKRGKVVAELRAPDLALPKAGGPGLGKKEMRIVGDIIGPTGEVWDVLR
jgi:hypothetical protein